MVTANSLQKVRVLSAFRPYLRILQTFNVECGCDKPAPPEIHQISRIMFVTVLAMAIPIVVFLGIWCMIESDQDAGEFATSSALVLTYGQMYLTAVAIMAKNRMISGAIDDFQESIDDRRLICVCV